MSAICRKDYHMGKGGGGLILKVIAHPFWKEATMHVKYWLDSSHLLAECSQEQVATRWESHVGTCFCESEAKAPAWAGGRGGRGGKLLLEGFRVGRETENNACTQHSYESCAEEPRTAQGPRGLLVHPKASSL